MNQEKTQFRLNLNGISLELEGEKAFVEQMYRDIMKDIEEARRRNKAIELKSSASKASAKEAEALRHRARRDSVVWIHRCSELVHKIYMASPEDLGQLRQIQAIDTEKIATLYIDDKLLPKLMPQFDKGQTLWAELTPAGRHKIASASTGLTGERKQP